MRIGIMTPGLSRGDAVGNDAYGMIETLREAGFETVLFTYSGESDSPWPTYNYADARWKLDDESDLLIYHYCTVDELARATLRQLKCRLAVKYHNVTPSNFMTPYSDEFSYLTRAGRMMLDTFADLPLDWIIGASEYNLKEFRRLVGDQLNMVTIPVFNHVEELNLGPGDPATVQYVRTRPTNILSVGRLVPNKGHEEMLEAFALHLRHSPGRPHLHLVGKHDSRLESYTAHLKDIIARHAMSDAVSMHPIVDQSALASYYRCCDLFWTGSQHEGFCVPAVEAMAFGLPILSTTAGALRETCGGAAIYANSRDEMVAALGALLSDDELLVDLRRRGRKRYEATFHRRLVANQFMAFINRWIDSADDAAKTAPEMSDADYWFDLPQAVEMVAKAITACPRLSRGLYARDRRLDLVFWMLTEGLEKDDAFAAYLHSAEVSKYAKTLGMPHLAGHLTADQRLIWTFSRQAQELFPLQDRNSVASFSRWYHRGRRLGTGADDRDPHAG